MNCSEKKIERTSHSDFFHFPPQKSRFKNTILQSEQWAYTFEGGGNFKRNPKPLQAIFPSPHVFKTFSFSLIFLITYKTLSSESCYVGPRHKTVRD